MKKITLLSGAILLTGSMLAAALDTVQVNGVYYQLDNGTQTASVIRKDAKSVYTQEHILIPVTVSKDGKTYDVTAVGRAAFSKSTCLTIEFAEGSKVTEIGMQAFQGAVGIKELALPEGVKLLPMTAIHGVGANAGMVLHKLTLPSTIDSLAVMSLQAAAIDTIVCNAAMPPHCALATGKDNVPSLPFTSNNAEIRTPKAAKIIVPAGSEKYYKAEAGWDYFDCFAAAETDTLRAGSLYYSVKADSASVIADLTGGTYGTLTSVEIPAAIDRTTCTVEEGKSVITRTGLPVVALGKKAFCNNKTIASVTFAAPSKIENIMPQAMQHMEGMTGTLELPEGLKFIATSGIYSGVKGGQMPVKKLILPATLDSLDVISVILNELETLEFRGARAPKCRVRVTATQTQIPWMIAPTNTFPTPKDVEIILPEGAYDSYKAQAGIGDYFDYFTRSATRADEVKAAVVPPAKRGIYNAAGMYLGTDATGLPAGMYIIDGRKAVRP